MGFDRSNSARRVRSTSGLALQKGPQAHFHNLPLASGQGHDARPRSKSTGSLATPAVALSAPEPSSAPLPEGHGEVVFPESGSPAGPATGGLPPQDVQLHGGEGQNGQQATTPPRDDGREQAPPPITPPEDGQQGQEQEGRGHQGNEQRGSAPGGDPDPNDPPPAQDRPPPTDLRVVPLAVGTSPYLENAANDPNDIHRLVPARDTPRDTMLARVEYLRERLAEAAAAAPPPVAGQRVQNVLVAPEWFFRVPQPAVGYVMPLSVADRDAIVRALEVLSGEYRDWLIVPGTLFHTLDSWETPPSAGAKRRMVNEAVALFGGEVVGGFTKKNEQDALQRSQGEQWGAAEAGRGSTRFEVNGMLVALEVCQDHTLARTLTESAQETDLHIVVSNNVTLWPYSVVARPGGLVVHADGHTGRAQVRRVTQRGDPAELHAMARDAANNEALMNAAFDRGDFAAGGGYHQAYRDAWGRLRAQAVEMEVLFDGGGISPAQTATFGPPRP